MHRKRASNDWIRASKHGNEGVLIPSVTSSAFPKYNVDAVIVGGGLPTLSSRGAEEGRLFAEGHQGDHNVSLIIPESNRRLHLFARSTSKMKAISSG